MTIRTGIGGWTYPAWRGGAFFPAGLRQREEHAFATRAVAMIEVNATFYRLQKPASFRAWRAAAPPGFIYSLKGSRFVTNRKVLATAGEGIANFLMQGLAELGDMLGPIVWQLPAGKLFEPNDCEAFLALLPDAHKGMSLRHAIEVGHPSFACAEFVSMARRANVAIVFSDVEGRTPIADRSADFAYLRLQGMRGDCATGYPWSELDRLARICNAWSLGDAPGGLPYAGDPGQSTGVAGDVFALMINGAKERAPAAAAALFEQIALRRGGKPAS